MKLSATTLTAANDNFYLFLVRKNGTQSLDLRKATDRLGRNLGTQYFLSR